MPVANRLILFVLYERRGNQVGHLFQTETVFGPKWNNWGYVKIGLALYKLQ